MGCAGGHARSWRTEEAARAAFDLAIVSVLLDAGAGTRWTYHDRVSGATIGRSEGLALATLTMFEEGAFSADPSDPLRVDAAVLRDLPAEKFRRGFQINDANPLVGVEGRIDQLRRLGQVVANIPRYSVNTTDLVPVGFMMLSPPDRKGKPSGRRRSFRSCFFI